MTITEMRAILGLANTVSDAAVVAAYSAYLQGGNVPAEIVTLQEARDWLRVTADESWHDATIKLLIAAATETVLGIADAYDRADPVPDRIKLAILTHIARAFSDREDGAELPAGAARLVMPLRTVGC